MTPLQFEQDHRAEWDELERLLNAIGVDGSLRRRDVQHSAAIVRLYRLCCEHLALARARGYPVGLVDRLEYLTGTAHQLVYQRREWGWWQMREFLRRGFPRAVRSVGTALWVALSVFVLPALILGPLVYKRPELIYSVMSAESADDLQSMYAIDADSFGRLRTAETDWNMFGYYIRHNIGIAFECFASGLFVGLGSLLALGINGVILGAVAGFLTARGLGVNFWPFVATHSAFELTAIVLAGAAGVKIGSALVAPGRQRRIDALVVRVQEAVPIVYGVVLMLLIAAAIEAFWSSNVWLPPMIKFAVAGVCWVGVLSYFIRQGRNDS